jgi:hypothetical protein
MMFMSFFAVLLALAPQVDIFKKEMAPLQSALDAVVTSTGAEVMAGQKSRAAYIDGYGIVISLELAFDAPQGIFGTPKKPAELRALVAQRRRDLRDKVTAFVTQRVATTDSIGPADSLAIVIYILNTAPADIPNLPLQIVMSAKKESPQQVAFREQF